jgi:hypothetical protein
MSMAITRWRGPLAEARGGATVDGERTCEAVLRFAVTDHVMEAG